MSSVRVLRRSGRRRRSRALPAVSRITTRSGASNAPLGHSARLGDALRASREALTEVERQLDALLAVVRAPAGRPAPDAADRLRRATKRAGLAINRLVS